MKLSEMRQILAERGVQLTKSLGQNFLHDGNQLRRIIKEAEIGPEDKVLEIGPGLGPLTELLVAAAGEVLAIEKDARLIEIMRQRFSAEAEAVSFKSAHLKLVEADALEYLKTNKADWREWKLVANLPYSVASPILVELALNDLGPKRIVVTLQLEVARRLTARPGTPDYGVLTLLVQLDYLPIDWFKIPAGCFFPQPDVESACVILSRRTPPLLTGDLRPCFVSVLKRSFSQRRKMMAKLLKEDWETSAVERALQETGLPSAVRAEMVSLEQFTKLTRILYERRNL